jgi:ABC-type multidrug transport system fused ATPase/permease subunit
MALPHGYDTEVGERGALLSAGERQLVAFARSWLADPTLLILDEATSNLDVATETRVTEAMRRLRQGRTTVVIAQIAVIEDGRVVEAGPTDQLLTRAAASSPTCMTAGSLAPHDRSGVVLPSRWLGRIRLT